MKPSQEKIWRKHYTLSDKVNPDVDCSAYHYIKNSFVDRMNGKAFDYYGKSITYPEMFSMIDRYANALKAMGVKPGDKVTMIMPNTPEGIYFFYALNKIGAVTLFIDPRKVEDLITHFIETSKSRVLITLDLMFPKCQDIIEKFHLEHVIIASASISLPFLLKIGYKIKAPKVDIPYSDRIMSISTWLKTYEHLATAEEAVYEHDSVSAVVLTGGTTGIPKGVMLTNFSINSVARDIAIAKVFRDDCRRFLDIIPIFSSYGLIVGLHTPMVVKAEEILAVRYEPEDFPKMLAKYKPNGVIAVPAFYDLWFSSKELAKADMSNLYVCIAGGDKMTAVMENKCTKFLQDRGGHYHVAQGYGMSEVSSVASMSFEEVVCPGSAGIPLYHSTMGVFKPDTDEELDYNEQGEICMSGDTLMKGYMGMPEETDIVMRRHSDGKLWVHSGDVGYIDENGFVHVRSRLKHMITKFNGHKTFALQIENVIYQLPEVETCAAIGCIDKDHAVGHVPLAIVKRHPGEMSDEELRNKIMDYCQKNIDPRDTPVDVMLIDEFPLTGFGKIDVKVLTEKYKRHDYKSNNN